MLAAVDYRELPLPPELLPWVAAVWTLAGDGDAARWIEHSATPDGCVELVRRTHGRSTWRRAQPAVFATGLSEHPIGFGFSGDAAFTGIKLWPWAWHALGAAACPTFLDDWIAVPRGGPIAALIDAADPVARLCEAFGHRRPDAIAAAIRGARGTADIAAASGAAPRRVQRWFAQHVGIAPLRYLRVIRFGAALAAVQASRAPIAHTAAGQGYADQAHMARDFRALAGAPPSIARGRALGPFIASGEFG